MSQIERHYANLIKALQDNEGAPCESQPDIFYPEDQSWVVRDLNTRIAKAMCSNCPVINQCIIYAMTSHEPHGIWGGTTADERKKRARKTNG